MRYLFLLGLALPLATLAQKKNSLTIILPPGIQHDQFNVYYYNGAYTKRIQGNNNSDSIVIRDVYYSLHGVVEVIYMSGTSGNRMGVYYVDDKPAVIRYTSKDLSHPQLINVMNADPLGIDALMAYTKKEVAAIDEAYQRAEASPSDSANAVVQERINAEMFKKFEYIKQHATQYYSLYTYKSYVNFTPLSADSLIIIFHQIFPASFRNSYEGNDILAILKARKLREEKQLAPAFTEKDIRNKTVSLHQFKNKYVLINFWASWCRPCVAEMPVLNAITKDIPGDKLVKIFFTIDSDTLAFEKARVEHKVEGIHIFARDRLRNMYEAYGIPKLYLVDKNGKIIYDNDKISDPTLQKLAALLKEI